MSSAASKVKWSRDVLVTATKQLEMLYKQQQDPCLALMISRNYRLLHSQIHTIDEQEKCLENARLWQGQYKPSRTNKIAALFYGANSLSYDSI
jgi:hypothetical protein